MLLYFKFLFLLPVAAFLNFIDILKHVSFSRKLYGLYGFVGLAGHGKTYSAVRMVHKLKEKFPDAGIISNIQITDKYGKNIVDKELVDYRQLLLPYQRNMIVLIDEIPSLFQARSWAEFPPELMGKLTMLRKDYGMLIIYTAQRFSMIDKVLRLTTDAIYICDCYYCYLNKLKKVLPQNIDGDTGLIKNSEKALDCEVFLQKKWIRNSYDTGFKVKKLRSIVKPKVEETKKKKKS